ncbi:MAG: hypothetical protein RLZZ58_2244 [Pseudomonadota bacterium]
MSASMHPNPAQTSPRGANGSTREARTSRLLKASVHCARLGTFDVVVRNISEHGIGGKTPRDFSRDEAVMVTLCGMDPVPGVVRWAWDGKFGIQTLTPIPLPEIQSAHGGHLPSSDAYQGEFEIMPPVDCETRRPTLSIEQIGRGDFCKSDWITD